MVSEFEDKKSSLFDLEELKNRKGLLAGDLLAVDPRLYVKFLRYIRRTVRRDVVTKNMVFLTGLSAYTKEPINLFLRGESSVGKSYNVREVLRLFPKGDVWFLGGLSPTALIHEKGVLVDKHGDPILPCEKPGKNASKEEKEAWRERLRDSKYIVDLQGKILVFLEAPHIQTYNMLRPILSHDTWEIDYKFTDRSGKGKLKTMHVVIRGWPATIFCSTQERYVQDLATRGFTVTPETTEEKYQAANVLTGERAAYPWKFKRDFDFMLLQGYIGFLKNKLQEIDVVVPYAEALAEKFPSKFPRSMRDFKHILSLIKVHALFHFAQRPALILENEKAYILAVRSDYEFAMGLWGKIRETTETFAPGHIIKFFHEVVQEVAKEKTEGFRLDDLTKKWNEKFADKRSSWAIRRWCDFLCNVGFLDKQPDPNDKRFNVYKVIVENQNIGNYEIFQFSNIFDFNSFKEWLKNVNETLEKKQFLLKDSLLSEKAQNEPLSIWKKYYSKNGNFSNISLSKKQRDLTKKGSKLLENKKIQQFPTFQLQDIKALYWVDGEFTFHPCGVCGYSKLTSWKAETFKGQLFWICDECREEWEKQRRVEA